MHRWRGRAAAHHRLREILICLDRIKLIVPDGQITSDFQKSCQAPKSKIFRFAADPNQMHILSRPGPIEGRFAIVTDVGQGMRWTRRRQASNSEPDE